MSLIVPPPRGSVIGLMRLLRAEIYGRRRERSRHHFSRATNRRAERGRGADGLNRRREDGYGPSASERARDGAEVRREVRGVEAQVP